ncbi:MAG: ABC transporter ATP-binding protein [Deltaproteobacteria bacterium]|nr:ABC transporter ATP-binding protein [Deltaproteobacteria bacterium]
MTEGKNIFEEKKLVRTRDLGLLKRLFPYVRPYRRLLSLALILIMIITVAELAIPYVTKTAIDSYIVPRETILVEDKNKQSRYLKVGQSDPELRRVISAYPDIIKSDGNAFIILYEDLEKLPREVIAQLRSDNIKGISYAVAALIILIIVTFLLTTAQILIMEFTGQRMMHDLRMQLFSHIQGLAVRFFTKNPVGRLVTRVTNDTQNMHEMFTSVVVFVIKDIFLIVGITVVLFSIDWRLSLYVYLLFPLVFYTAYRFSRVARGAFRTLRVKIAEINSKFSETIGGMQVIQIFNQAKANYLKFKGTNREYYEAAMEQITVFAIFMPLIELISSIALAIVIFYGGGSLLSERITLGTLVVFISYLKMFFRPIRDMAEKYNIALNAFSSAERIFLILDEGDVLPEAVQEDRKDTPKGIESLAFDRVSFSYVAGETILYDVSFSIGANETIAVVGPTGAGKTTLVNLITRFYDPDAGTISMNGTDIRRFSVAQLRSKIAIVMQDPFVFSNTIRDNIFAGREEAGEEEIDAILETSYCKTFIDRLSRGLETEMMEGGSSLSSGERQLLSIARALAHNPQLIIFDEATSYIDSETEERIQNALFNLTQNRMAIIIAHRLSTARIADRIIVLREGRIVETGTHSELITRRGFYYRLQELQG